jgi:hypothetical protein
MMTYLKLKRYLLGCFNDKWALFELCPLQQEQFEDKERGNLGLSIEEDIHSNDQTKKDKRKDEKWSTENTK